MLSRVVAKPVATGLVHPIMSRPFRPVSPNSAHLPQSTSASAWCACQWAATTASQPQRWPVPLGPTRCWWRRPHPASPTDWWTTWQTLPRWGELVLYNSSAVLCSVDALHPLVDHVADMAKVGSTACRRTLGRLPPCTSRRMHHSGPAPPSPSLFISAHHCSTPSSPPALAGDAAARRAAARRLLPGRLCAAVCAAAGIPHPSL